MFKTLFDPPFYKVPIRLMGLVTIILLSNVFLSIAVGSLVAAYRWISVIADYLSP